MADLRRSHIYLERLSRVSRGLSPSVLVFPEPPLCFLADDRADKILRDQKPPVPPRCVRRVDDDCSFLQHVDNGAYSQALTTAERPEESAWLLSST